MGWDDFIMALSGYPSSHHGSVEHVLEVIEEHVLEHGATRRASWLHIFADLYQLQEIQLPTPRVKIRGLYIAVLQTHLAVKCCNPSVANGSMPGTLEKNITACKNLKKLSYFKPPWMFTSFFPIILPFCHFVRILPSQSPKPELMLWSFRDTGHLPGNDPTTGSPVDDIQQHANNKKNAASMASSSQDSDDLQTKIGWKFRRSSAAFFSWQGWYVLLSLIRYKFLRYLSHTKKRCQTVDRIHLWFTYWLMWWKGLLTLCKLYQLHSLKLT